VRRPRDSKALRAYLRHLPSLPFLQGAAAGLDHHNQE
jgi:hypothetical protein